MSRKILLVDDSKTALMYTQMVLQQRTSHVLLTALDGQQALDTAITALPDLILMDVVMPNLNGFQACQRLREHPHTANIPVILLTTRGEAECVEAGFASGCNDYLTKPVDGDELVTMVEAYLGRA